MPAKAKEQAGVEGDAPSGGEVAKEPNRFHVDLPQFVEVETQRPHVVPLQPVPDKVPFVPTTLRERLTAAATNWRVKGAVQKVLGVVPGGHAMHRQLQLRVGGLKDFASECDAKVDDWRRMMEHVAHAKVHLPHAALLELGAGRYPTFAACLFLSGAEQVLTTDLKNDLDPALTVQMVDRLREHLPLIAQVSRRAEADVRAAHAKLFEALQNGATIARASGSAIAYRAPADASRTGFPSNTIDVVFSNSLLEHVPVPMLEACFAESMRILRPGGIVYHSVNCGDHYAYRDATINQLHYLAYSDEEWQFWNNEFLYQNRLRAIDFTRMAERVGFAIELDTSRAHPDRLAQLEKIAVHARFAQYTRPQLAVTSIDFIGRKPAADEPGN
jgi:SAM-dependent methyltransferase